MGGLDDPSSWPPGRVADLLSYLLAAGADVRLEALVDSQVTNLVEVIAAVEAQPLRRVVGRDRPRDRSRRKRRLQQLYVVAIGTIVGEPDRDARGLCED